MSWVGCVVLVDCGEIGNFEGKVSEIDDSEGCLKLKNASLDGNRLPSDVILRIAEISDLKIISQDSSELDQNDGKQLQFELETIKEQPASTKKNNAGKRFSTPDQKRNPGNENRKSFKKKNKECFGTPLDDIKVPDFDFEKNLKLFNKEAIFEELRGSKAVSSVKRPQGGERKLRHDESVLEQEQEPVNLRQIVAPLEHTGREYHTDEGVIVPCVSVQLRNKLIKVSENMGFSEAQRVENAALCTCQMALQLVGGSNRLTRRNAHQAPHVVVLAGPNTVGIEAICAARHLANHKVQVTLSVPLKTEILVQHLALFFHTGSKLVSNVSDLPKEPVDLVIHALFSPEEESTNQISSQLTSVNQWANDNKAPVLLLDPCSRSRMLGVESKWSLSFGLPLIDVPSECRTYLADIGIPKGIYSAVNVNYTSPFGEKFVIALNQ